MIIDRNYILNRFAQLIAANEFVPHRSRRINLYRIKMAFPEWIRSLLFHPYNPLYLLWRKSNPWEGYIKKSITYSRREPMSVDFIQYCFTHDIKLDSHDFLDQQDDEIVDFIDKKIKTFLTGFKDDIPNRKEGEKERRREEQFIKKIKYKRGFYQVEQGGRTYYLPYNKFSFEVFNSCYGLDKLPEKVVDALSGKDFLDAGAFYGDSSIVFLPCNPRKIYAYEPIPFNYNVLLKTIRKNAPDIMVPVKKGLGDSRQILPIGLKSSASSLLPAFRTGAKTVDIEIDTIDNECKDKNVGLIKMDVEGFEYNVIKGGLETICRDKPVLLISIYHTGKDFFEIMPMIRAHCPEYKFLFVDMAPAENIAEKMIIAYCL
jgi:FkbM family methyltransferase